MAGKVIITGSVTVNATGGVAGKRGDGGNRGAYREHRTNWIATAASTSGTGGDGHEGANGGDDTSAKINETVEKYGPKSIVMNVFYCGIPGSRMSTTDRMCNRFLNTFGMSKLENCFVIDPEEKKKKHPLHFYIGRHKYFMQGQFSNSPEMMELAKSSFGAALNTKTAMEYGLRDGDEIEVFNDRGVMKAKLQLMEDIPDYMCHTWYTFDESYYYPYGNKTPQDLATPQNAPETSTPWAVASGKKWYGIQKAAGVPDPAMFIAGQVTPEVIFDVTCDVRKAK